MTKKPLKRELVENVKQYRKTNYTGIRGAVWAIDWHFIYQAIILYDKIKSKMG